jgi:hypothetical protein
LTFDNNNVLGAPKNICGNIAESLLEIQNVLAKFCRKIKLTRLVPVFLRQLCSVWCSWSCLSPTWCDQTCDANKTWLAWSIIIFNYVTVVNNLTEGQSQITVIICS